MYTLYSSQARGCHDGARTTQRLAHVVIGEARSGVDEVVIVDQLDVPRRQIQVEAEQIAIDERPEHRRRLPLQISQAGELRIALRQLVVLGYEGHCQVPLPDHRPPSQNVLTYRYHRASCQTVIAERVTERCHRASSQSAVTERHNRAPLQSAVTTDAGAITERHYYSASTSSQSVITERHYKASLQSVIAERYYRASTESAITEGRGPVS